MTWGALLEDDDEDDETKAEFPTMETSFCTGPRLIDIGGGAGEICVPPRSTGDCSNVGAVGMLISPSTNPVASSIGGGAACVIVEDTVADA